MNTMFDPRGFNFDKLLSNLYIYTGVFLSEETRSYLLEIFPPKHENVYADHITLCFKPSPKQVMETEHWSGVNGKFLYIYVTHEVSDVNGHALMVECPGVLEKGSLHKLPLTTPVLHITISCAEGVSPSYSNKLLRPADTDNIFSTILRMNPNMKIRGLLGVCAQTDRNYLSPEVCKRRGLVCLE
jgi:hypothetical protein